MRELAEQVASILRAELTFDKPPTSGDRELYEEPPSRGDFTRIGRVPAAKARFAPELCDDIEEMKHLFCMVSGEFVLTSGVDVDHAIAYSQIRRRQLAFLALLNEQAEFAETFLTQPDMDNYFGRNESGVIQGRGYFYKACYNDLDNLWLLCHACNVEKSDQEALTWFAKQEPYFGEAFVKCVEEAGGLHAGLLIDRVYYDTGTDTKFLIGEKEVTLHEGESQGLGQFVRNWFFEHFKEHYEIHKEFYTKNFALLKEQLLEIQALAEGGAAPEVIQARFNHLHRRLEQLIVVQEALKKYAEETSSSGRHKDSSVSEEAKEALSGNTIRLEETRSLYTRIRALIEVHYGEEFMREACPADQFKFLSPDPCRVMLETLTKRLSVLPLPSETQLHNELLIWYEINSTTREELQEKLLAAQEAKEVAERRAEEERAGREAAEARIKALEKRLAAAGLDEEEAPVPSKRPRC